MTPKSVIAFHLVIFLLYLWHADAGEACPDAACSGEGPSVRSPFWLKARQPESCGYPGFELSCSERNETLIEIPYSGKFFLARIDYEHQNIYMADPQGCMARRLITLNITGSPFTIYAPNDVTLINCSLRLESPELLLIYCLSSSNYHVYAVDYAVPNLGSDILSSCSIIEVVTPSYISSYEAFLLNGNDYFRDYATLFYNFTKLSWDIPECDIGCRERRKWRLKGNNSSEVECSDEYLPPCQRAKNEGVSIGAFIGILTLALMVTSIFLYLRLRRLEAEDKQKKIKKFLEDCRSLNPTRYSFVDVQKMTNEFKKKLGQGGYGSVFEGELENGVPVAVKVLDNSKGNGGDFTNEISIIGRIHHVNVVRLFGYCADGLNRALVYEFMPNMSLDKFIFPANSRRPKLSWGKLQDIAIGVARGIEYLHQGCDQRILHFDIKPQNILLDIDFNPKISDFGLAKLFPKKESIVSITAVRGTMGYIAPEVYFSRNIGNVSYKTDIYSFGMLLFEMVGGRKNKDPTVENTSQVYFPQWVYNRLADGEDLGIKEEKDGDAEIAKKLSVVAIWCVQWDPIDRPSISIVIQMLEGRTGSLPLPPDPFASLSSEVSDMNVP